MKEDNIQNIRELMPGTTLNRGKYVIEREIGEGGFGITYKAVQTGLNRPVCIKEYFLAGLCVRNTRAKTVQLQGSKEDTFEKYRQAFVREAQTLANLHHPNIVEVIDIFDENNTSYMVMPFIEGRSLQSIVEKNGPLSYPEAVNFIVQVASAVGYIHERNILHRDIKPDNIMITEDYKAILIDFGSAREFQQDKTQQHTSLLTHGYAPPEQYTASSRKGSYTDIYALGATLYFILTGQVPLEAAARLNETITEPKSLNPDITKEANKTIMTAMQLKTTDRYQTVQEFINDLCNGDPKLAEASVETQTVLKKQKKYKWMIVAMIGVVLLLGGAVASILVVQKQNEKQAAEEAMEAEAKHIHKLDSLYTATLESVEVHLGRINLENEHTNPTHVIEGLNSLKTLEDLEKAPLFVKTGYTPCYRESFSTYITKLEKEQADITQIMEDIGDKENIYYQGLEKKSGLISSILDQAETGSAAQIEIKKPGNTKQ